MDVVQNLQGRRTLALLNVEMLFHVGKGCEGAKLEREARMAYAVMCVLMEQMDQIDQALAAIKGGSLKEQTVDLTCQKCQQQNMATARLNVFLRDAENAEWEEFKCAGCGAVIGAIRADKGGLPKGCVLEIGSVLDVEPDGKTIVERMPEAAAIAQKGVVKPGDLPPAAELRAAAVLQNSDIVAVGSEGNETTKRRHEIQSRLETARAKVGAKTPAPSMMTVTAPFGEDEF